MKNKEGQMFSAFKMHALHSKNTYFLSSFIQMTELYKQLYFLGEMKSHRLSIKNLNIVLLFSYLL
jgi:hypothetical protein